MRRRPQTLIAMVRDAVEEWRKRERLSISSVVQCIVEVHERLGLDVVTDTHFDSDKDAMRRQLTNGERVYRWLDDVTKHNNLLPANFLPSILAALPMDLRIECVNHILQPAALSVREMDGADGGSVGAVLQRVAKETGDATCAIAALVDGATPDELTTAQREITEAMSAQEAALHMVESLMNAVAAPPQQTPSPTGQGKSKRSASTNR